MWRPIFRSRWNRFTLRSLEETLGASSWLSVPVRWDGESAGRIYLLGGHRAWGSQDAEFLAQVAERLYPFINHLRWMDLLASQAGEQERQRVARDLHDTILQPFIAIQMGLRATHAQHESQGIANSDIETLLQIADTGISELRWYVRDLRADASSSHDFLTTLRQYADTFRQTTGIVTAIEIEGPMEVNERLSCELMMMIREGLSNIRKHTRSAHAHIRMESHPRHLTLHIRNNADERRQVVSFKPRSITERALALGGHARVELNPPHDTTVRVEIPL